MITAAPTAPAGSVTRRDSYAPSDFLPTDALLCRNTAPLVTFAFGALRRRLACRILGRDIAKGLRETITDTKATTLEELVPALKRNEAREIKRAMANENPAALANVMDRYAAIACFVNNAKSVLDILITIDELFKEKENVLTLATIHKAKGLEWPRVWFLDSMLIPSPWATQGWQKQQERNLKYVGVSRAKVDLIYINSGNWKPTT